MKLGADRQSAAMIVAHVPAVNRAIFDLVGRQMKLTSEEVYLPMSRVGTTESTARYH